MQKSIVVVGATTGLGRATARCLARDHHVFVAARDAERARTAVPGAAEGLAVDLADLADVRRFARELARRGPLHAIACNAGGQNAGPVKFTKDGYETTFAVNHLAHFTLVLELLEAGAFAEGARIGFVGSGTIAFTPDRGKFGFRGPRYTSAQELAAGMGDEAVDDAQRGRDRYATSKLCNVLAAQAIARRWPGVETFALDPGLMPGTGLARTHSLANRVLWSTVLRVAALAMPGASTPGRSGAVYAGLLVGQGGGGVSGRYVDFRGGVGEVAEEEVAVERADELYEASIVLGGGEARTARASAADAGRSSSPPNG